MINTFSIAKEYAKAIFSLAVEQNTINSWKIALELFSKISKDTLIQSLCFKLLAPRTFSKIFIDICEGYISEKLDDFSCNLVSVVSENNRILLLPIIFERFNDLCREHMQYLKVEVISARELNDRQLQKISKKMMNYLSKPVKLVCSINQDILGGIILKVGDTIIDGSIKGCILRLNNILQF